MSVALVDVHSHVIPSGDDGAQSLADGLAMCRAAAERGTRVLYGTPHVFPEQGLSRDREARVRENAASMAEELAEVGLELRLGFELTPAPALLREDLCRYALAGLERPAVLIEFPFRGDLQLLTVLAEHAEACGLRPILAHPERVEAVLADPGEVLPFHERGWLIQVNASSLLGRHGAGPAAIARTLLERGVAALVASDGHHAQRPPFLDDAYVEASQRLGERADAFFDGSALLGARLPG